MYGTVARMKAKPGRIDEVVALMEEWDRDFRPTIDGAVAGLTYRLDADPDTLITCAVFASKAKYFANADNPEQDKWYRRLRENLVADPEWNDGEIVFARSDGPLGG